MLNRLTNDQSNTYLDAANGDELGAAISLAIDRLEDDSKMPHGYEIHHALFLLRQPFEQPAPSWEETRIELIKRKVI